MATDENSRNGWRASVLTVTAGWEARPYFHKGVPRCSKQCPHHDGKRCELLGHRPDAICEPTVRRMAKQLDATEVPHG